MVERSVGCVSHNCSRPDPFPLTACWRRPRCLWLTGVRGNVPVRPRSESIQISSELFPRTGAHCTLVRSRTSDKGYLAVHSHQACVADNGEEEAINREPGQPAGERGTRRGAHRAQGERRRPQQGGHHTEEAGPYRPAGGSDQVDWTMQIRGRGDGVIRRTHSPVDE